MTNNTDSYSPESDAELVQRFIQNYTYVASIQGRLAYLIMSVHSIHPSFLTFYVTNSATRLLYVNMVYGIGIMIYSRPNMQPIGAVNRAAFSFLGSIMFCYSSMAVFDWIRDYFVEDSPYLATGFGLLAGRIFMLHLLAFLYHVDTRSNRSIPRNSAFDSMYYENNR